MHNQMHNQDTHDWLEPELRHGLREVTAPGELWNRVQTAGRPRPQIGNGQPKPSNRRLVWAMGAAVALIAVGLSEVHRQSAGSDEALALGALATDSQRIAFHCQNPSQLRAWVRAKTGLDLPLRSEASSSIQLIGAQMIDGARGVEVAYRAGNRDAILVVSRADSNEGDAPHNRASGNVSSWVMNGERFTLACNDSSDLQLACKLCHLD